MKTVLIAVDDTKGTKSAVKMFAEVCRCMAPSLVVLAHVEKLEGRSLMDEMLGEPELSALRDAMRSTDLKAALDRRAEKVFAFYRTALEEAGIANIKTVLRSGHPGEEIISAAKETGAEMIIIGSRSTRASRLFMGSVSREVADHAEVPVLLVKNPGA